MKNQELEARLRTALEHAAPNDLQGVLSRCQQQKGTVIYMKENARRRSPALRWAVAACLALFLIAGGFGIGYQVQNLSVASVVSLDVNPCVELKVNAKSRVLEANAVNEDGQIILQDMDLKNTDLNVAVNALVGALLRNGYVDELANSVLITVADDDTARAQQLQTSLSDQVNQALANAQVEGSVLSQTVDANSPLQQKADEYGISLGKATLIQGIVDQNSRYRFEDLVGLTVNELNLLASSQAAAPAGITVSGSASSGSYIGLDAAKAAAYQHAGIAAADVTFEDAEFDYENGRMVYELEFYAKGQKYEYDVDAATGEIVKYSSKAGSAGTGSGAVQTPALTADQARDIALTNAGLAVADVWDLSVELKQQNGQQVYEVEFDAAGAEYDYWVNAETGEILRSDNKTASASSSSTGTGSITADQARDIALTKAGLAAADVWDLKVEREHDHGVSYYEVEFESSKGEYKYAIDASNGAVLGSEEDLHAAGGTTASLTADQARDIALTNAGLALADVWDLEISLDEDDGRLVYDVEFEARGGDYEYEIDASSGSILEIG